ncbi:hypothetical protein ACNSOL_12310 (plasmid) [Aliarcobacter lanthieri]|uniref:hypothetical protein n=1 Tax=Aliarcobacter lanthieri TaxID=1355374 RepID=UPI003AAC2043
MKKYETRSYDYYDKKDSLNIICHVLAYYGWTIYGYKEDRSDFMTDYYDPARWDGIAVKNGFVLVMNNSYKSGTISGNYVLRSYTESANKEVNKLFEKNIKLQTLADNKAASKGEIDNALAMIEKNLKKIDSLRNEYYLTEDSSNPFPLDLPEVSYQINPGRSTWHIEKDGKIIAKGSGYFKYCDIEDTRFGFTKSTLYFKRLEDNMSINIRDRFNEESWKEHYEYILRTQEKNKYLLDDFFDFIQLLESKVALVLGEGSEEQELVKVIKEVKEPYYVAEYSNVETEYITVAKGWQRVGNMYSGDVYKIDENFLYRLTRKRITIDNKYIKAYKPVPNKSTKPTKILLEEKIKENKLSYVKLVEKFRIFEKEEWIKKTTTIKKSFSKKTVNDKSENKNSKFDEILSGEVEEIVNEKSNKKYKVVKIKEKLDLETFRELCSHLKDNKLGFYIKGKGVYLNSLNKAA